jgi:uncharacterized protein YbjT (DUF2867 family)
LLAAGRSVRVIVRDPGKSAVWSSRGCDVAVAEGTDAARWRGPLPASKARS